MALKVDYVVRETGTNLRRNLTLSFATMVTIAISLTLVGAALLMKQGVTKSNVKFHGDIQTIVYLKADASQEQVDLVGKALKDNPHVASMIYLDYSRGPGEWVPDCRPDYLKQAVEGSLKRLRLERIDLYQLHAVDPKVPIEESVGALKQMQDAGKIRHIGLSNVDPGEIAKARKIVPIVSVQNRYNIDDRESENVLEYCEKENLGFLPWFPIGGGGGLKPENPLNTAATAHEVSVYQIALAWLLARSPVMLPIPGTSSLAHLEENVAAAKLKLTPEEWKAIDSLAG